MVRISAALTALVCCVLAWAAGEQWRLAVALAVLLVCPGYLLERALLGRDAVMPLARPAVWFGLSLSAGALLYQWAATAGVSLLHGALPTLAAVCALGAVGLFLGRPRPVSVWPRVHALWPAALAVVVGLTAWTRAAQVRGLAAPVWVDSLHHALLVRVAAEQGHAPYALAPYLPIESLTYHSGFHALVAAVLGACGCGGGLGLPGTLLLVGQALNTLTALAWAGAAAQLWRRPVAAVTAAVVVGLASIMPAYYVSWGRYTLVAGVLMLPALMVAVDILLACRERRWAAAVAVALLLAGLSLVHFVVLCLGLLWCAAAVACAVRQPGRAAVWIGAAGALALALTLPWTAMLLSQARLSTGSSAVNLGGNPSYNALPTELLWASSNRALAGLAGLGALLALRRRRRAAVMLAVWLTLDVLAANPVLLGLPYLSFYNNEFLTITLFAPLAMLIAGGATALDAWAVERLRAPWRAPWPVVAAAGVLGAALWLAPQLQTVVRPDTVLATEADMRAIAWAARETPADARFVVNTAGWLYDVDRGADGGWWLLPLAGRQVTTPPVVFNYGPEAYVRGVKEETSWLRSGAGADPEALAVFMRSRRYSHVFATGRGRSVDAEQLRASPLFEELYRDGDVSIFRLAV
ncbi:MAG: hypothetical protein RLZZ387_5186 [Chloroflexota bacterium]|jgi:hypothetical protein